jgi:hypothetical protein
MSQEEKPFAVKDRRHFTADGEARETAPPPPEVSEAPPSAARPTPRSHAARPADFSQFLISLGAQAGLLLAPMGEGAPTPEALDDARALISILEMLKDKTEGRRTADEDRVLEGILYELRLGYVARAWVSGA